MPWMYAIAGLLVGVILGVAISRLMTPEYKKQKNVQKELDSAVCPLSSSDKSWLIPTLRNQQRCWTPR